MKKLSVTAAWLLIVLFWTCSWARAQTIPAGFDVFAEFGPSCLKGNVHSGASGEAKCEAGRVFAGARLRLARHDAIEVSHSYSPNVFDEAFPLLYENNRLTSTSFNYVRYLSTYSHLQPFATAGLGWEHFRGVGFSPSAAVVTGDTQFAWNFGAGIDVIPQRHFAIRFEFRDYLASIPIYHTSRLQNYVPSIGVVFRWKRNPKL
jgi:Outer membrane protein beta-barrel domain